MSYDVVILGGGSGGYACALRASQLGLSVVLIEADKVGGTCLHRGCIPTKALLHAGEVADSARHASEFGVNATFNAIDMAGVNAYKDGVIARLYKGLSGLVKSRGVTFVEGWGKLVSPNTVEVNGTQYTGKNVVLATGSYARTLPGLDIDGQRVITSDHGTSMNYVPKSVIVLGGGVIGGLGGGAPMVPPPAGCGPERERPKQWRHQPRGGSSDLSDLSAYRDGGKRGGGGRSGSG